MNNIYFVLKGRQSLKLRYEDYVKDREDVYAKVKRVFEEVDEAELSSEHLLQYSIQLSFVPTQRRKQIKESQVLPLNLLVYLVLQ